MTGRPTIGVALATYNGARFVGEQFTSILEQSRTADAIVVADDGSKDETLAVVRALADGRGTPITVLEGDRSLGVTANFERAVTALTTEVVALSDQDDRWHRTRLEQLGGHFSDGSVTLVHTDADLIDDDGAPLGRTLFESLEIRPDEFAAEETGRAFEALLRRNLATGATVLFRRDLLEVALPFPREWVHDEWLAIMAAATGGVRVVREATIDYRQHASNEIGVAEPTLARKVKRVLEPRAERNRLLATRFRTLAERLEQLGGRIPAGYVQQARAKAAFEERRAAMPASRLRRAVPVLRLARTGAYGRYASRGRADIVRDLVQPA